MTGLTENLTNPALLFFILGILAVHFKNDLKIPESSSKFISIYLLLCIGFKGGNELSHSPIEGEVVWGMLLGFVLSAIVPVAAFFLLRRKLSSENAGAIAAAYGSVSAVTFVTAISFLDFEGSGFSGYMIAVMALMEAPAIVAGILLIKLFGKNGKEKSRQSLKQVFNHALNNPGVFLIFGSLIIGLLASDQHAEGIKPFTTDLFVGFLILFLLDMGMQAGKQLGAMYDHGLTLMLFAALFPFVNGMLAMTLASTFTLAPGNLLLFSVLGAGASYIAVPAALKQAVPEANPGLYLPMALGITFPVNVIIGIPFYWYIIEKYFIVA